ncbi:MAG TPA: hypothetical protein VFJ07_25280, partial [Streptosporangiaceae bacterium]|nr:hypothetical protein [Streptosporangiaceae bacterium]
MSSAADKSALSALARAKTGRHRYPCMTRATRLDQRGAAGPALAPGSPGGLLMLNGATLAFA